MSWIVLVQASFPSWLGRDLGAIGPGRIYTKFWVAAVTLVIGVSLMAAHQFLTLRLVRSVTLAVACLGSVALVGQFFPRDWVPALGQLHQPAVPVISSISAEAISFEVLPAIAVRDAEARRKRSTVVSDTELSLWMRVHGVPVGLYLGADRAAHAWTWPDGVRVARSEFYAEQYFDMGNPELRQRYSLPLPADDPETMAWRKAKQAESDARRKARGLPSLWRNTPAPIVSGKLLQSYVSLPHSFVDKMHREPSRYTTRFEAILYRQDPMAEVPLQVGARAAYGGNRFRVALVGNGMPLLVSTRPAVTQRGVWYSGEIKQGMRPARFPDPIVALNLVTGHISWVGDDQTGSKFLQVAGVILNWNYLHIFSPVVIRDGKNVGLPGIDPQWADHTKLVFLAGTKVGRFSREVTAEKFTVRASDREAGDDTLAPDNH
jgi:hypothetical protein